MAPGFTYAINRGFKVFARALFWLPLVVALWGCAPGVSTLTTTPVRCSADNGSDALRWIAPANPQDAEKNANGCSTVGPSVLHGAPAAAPGAATGALLIVSWNVATDGGHVEELLRNLVDEERRAERPEPRFVLLLQEAFRRERPAAETLDVPNPPRSRLSDDVVSLASKLGLHLAYVPSMPHRRSTRETPAEDRGNAILSTLPLRDVTAVELPFVRQRRVAVLAGVEVDGWRLTLGSVHLDTRSTMLRGSIFSGPLSRERQAAALTEALGLMRTTGPVIVGGDFNTVAGLKEPAIRMMERQLARVECGEPITHRWGFALDHVFVSTRSILDGCRRVGKRYGSDHHPLVARVSRTAVESVGPGTSHAPPRPQPMQP